MTQHAQSTQTQHESAYHGDRDDIITAAREESDYGPELGDALVYVDAYYRTHGLRAEDLPVQDTVADALLWGVAMGIAIEANGERLTPEPE